MPAQSDELWNEFAREMLTRANAMRDQHGNRIYTQATIGEAIGLSQGQTSRIMLGGGTTLHVAIAAGRLVGLSDREIFARLGIELRDSGSSGRRDPVLERVLASGEWSEAEAGAARHHAQWLTSPYSEDGWRHYLGTVRLLAPKVPATVATRRPAALLPRVLDGADGRTAGRHLDAIGTSVEEVEHSPASARPPANHPSRAKTPRRSPRAR